MNIKWKIVPLSTVATIERSAIQPNEIRKGTLYLGLEHIESGGMILGAKVVDEGELASSKFKFSKDHVLYGKLRPYLAKITCPDFNGICSTDILPILPKPNLERRFLCRYLRQPAMVEYAHSRSTGANLPRLSPSALADFQIPLPPLPEQKRIAAILDTADAMRAKRRESLAQLDVLLQSTFLDMFGNPVTNPKEWKVVKFQSIGSSRLGKMLDKGKQIGNSQFPYLANFNVQWGRFELSDLRYMDFSEDDREEFSLKAGDILICEGGEVGRTAIWRGERHNVYFQKALHRVRLNQKLSIPEYIQYFMWFMAKNGGFKDFTTSATIAHLTGAKLKTLPVPLPPLDRQRRFATIVEAVEKQKYRLRAHLAELDTLFASLQHRAFNGEL